MSKDVMGAPKGRAAILGALKSEATALESAPPVDNVQPIRSEVADITEPDDQLPTVSEGRAPVRRVRDLNPNQMRDLQREWAPKKEARDQAVARYPVSLLEDLDTIVSITKMTKQQIMEDALRKEVAFWKKRIGLD